MSFDVVSITLRRRSNVLDITFADQTQAELPAELLRVYSPSAEVRGHGARQIRMPAGKQHVRLLDVQSVGHYAVQLTFDDGHSSGLYTWEWLYQLATGQEKFWRDYLEYLHNTRQLRDDAQVINIVDPASKDPS